MWFGIITVVFIIISVAMALVILVQRPQGGGLAGAFGGAGGGGADTVFGGRVGDALTWATSIMFVLFLALAISLNLLDNPSSTTGEASSAAESAENVESPDDAATESGTPAGETPDDGGERP